MTAAHVDATSTLCVICPPQRARVARASGMTCWDCHDRVRTQLRELVIRYLKLTAAPSAGAGVARRAPGYGSRPPLNLHAAMLRDPRTAPAEVGEPHAPLNLLLTWGRWIRRERTQPAVRYPAGAEDGMIVHIEASYLLSSLDWVTRQQWVGTFAEQLRAVVSQLRSATGEPNPKPVATCACGHALFPPRHGESSITCAGCEAVYDPLEQVRLARVQLGECALCRHLGTQHDNDAEAGACNVQWCSCARYEEASP